MQRDFAPDWRNVMDMNQLFSNHQRAVMNARKAESVDDRTAYVDLVEHYATRIHRYRAKLGLPLYRWS